MKHILFCAGVALALTACAAKDTPADSASRDAAPAAASDPAPATTVGEPIPPEAQMPSDTIGTALGRGSLERADGELASFTIDATFRENNVVEGEITYSSFFEDGKLDLVAKITCGEYDDPNKRVWVGGEISENKSTRDDLKTGRYAVGQPAWIRFEESATHPEPRAKVSDLGLAGDGGVRAASDFCTAKSWSDEGLADVSAQGAVILFTLPQANGD